ncbi:DUF916 domain-containing protein [Candidatus Peregrinibacteria bacterium]|nr:DUF916 domain-containing protein [Candidatus Peregrinibacteria bacterium]
MKKTLTILLTTLLSIPNCFALSFNGLDLSPTYPNEVLPSNFSFQLKPGDSVDEYATLTNQTDQPIGALLYAVDSGINNQNETVLMGKNDPKNLVGKWIKFDSTGVITLQPKEKKIVKFTITAPAEAEKKDYIGGIALERTDYTDNKEVQPGATIKTNTRVGIRTFVKITDTPEPIKKIPLPEPQNNTEWSKYYLYFSVGLFVIVLIGFSINAKRKKAK